MEQSRFTWARIRLPRSVVPEGGNVSPRGNAAVKLRKIPATLHRLDRALTARKDHLQSPPHAHQLPLELELLLDASPQPTEQSIGEWREAEGRRVYFCEADGLVSEVVQRGKGRRFANLLGRRRRRRPECSAAGS